MVEVHLITGGTGAGKTTYALRLAKEIGGVRFSIDEWMTNLFWMDSPQPIQFEWTMERIGRCEAQIKEQMGALVAVEVPCVLDLGFTEAHHRLAFGEFARSLGAEPRLHHLDLAADIRWQRVQQRNLERGETYRLDVDRGMFDFMEEQFEKPGADEMRLLNGSGVS